MPPKHILVGSLLPALFSCNALFGIEDLVPDNTPANGGHGGRGDGGSATSAGGIGANDGGFGGSGGASGGGGQGGTGLVGRLADTGLLARYYFDEAPSGQMPAAVLDHAPDPLDVPILYDDGLTYEAAFTGRGLRWAAGTNGRATIALDGTKVRNLLAGSKTATLEIVFAAISPTVDFAVLAQILPPGGQFGRFGAGLYQDAFPFFQLNYTTNQAGVSATWDTNVVGIGRFVSHFVLDTEQQQKEDRVRFYENGEPAPPSAAQFFVQSPGAGEIINICTACVLTFGNMPAVDRPLNGILYYVAIYASALAIDEIANNVGVLLLNDDAPSPP